MRSFINKHELLLVIFLAIILRLVSLNQSLWLDEATTAQVATNGLRNYFSNFAGNDFHPPLYYLVLIFLTKLIGDSEVILRSVSLFAGVGTVILIYYIVKILNNSKYRHLPLISSLFLATSGLHMYYSQEARMYSTATFLVSLSTYLFITKRHKLFEISIALMVLTHYLTIFVMGIYYFYMIITRKSWHEWRKFIISQRLLILFLFLWSGFFVTQLTNGLGVESSVPAWWNILGKTTPKEIALIGSKFIFGRISIDNNLYYGLATISVGSIYLLIILRSVGKFKSIIEFTKDDYFLVYVWFVLPIFLAAIVGLFIPVFSYFRLLFVLPAMYILLSLGIVSLKKNWMVIAVIFVLSVNVVSSAVYLFNSKFHREDWKTLVEYVENEPNNSAVLFVSNSQMEAYRYYSRNSVVIYPDQLNSNFDTIWLMRYVQDIFDPNDLVRSRLESMGYIKELEYNFNGVVVWKYRISK